MSTLITEAVYAFTVAVAGTFVVMCGIAGTGSFDTWGRRYLDQTDHKPM